MKSKEYNSSLSILDLPNILIRQDAGTMISHALESHKGVLFIPTGISIQNGLVRPRQMVITNRPEVLREGEEIDKDGIEWETMREMIGFQSSFTSRFLDKHRAIAKKITTRALSQSEILQHVSPTIESSAQILATWDTSSPINMEDLHRKNRNMMMRLICGTLFGFKVDEDLAERITSYYVDIYKYVVKNSISGGAYHKIVSFISSGGKIDIGDAVRGVEEFSRRVFEEGNDTKGNLLKAIKQNDQLLYQEQLDEIKAEIGAAFGTTAIALTQLLTLLAMPQYRHFQDDIRVKLGKDIPTMDLVVHNETLQHCIREALRLYPPNPVITRNTTKPVVIDGRHIPAGSKIVFDLYSAHHDRQKFKNPDTFNPDRYFGDGSVISDRPFWSGPRACSGKHYANMSLGILTALMLQQFEFSTESTSIKPQYAFPVVRPDPSVHLNLQRIS